VTGGKGTATRTVGLLGGIFSYAFDCGLIELNPVHGVKRYADKKGQRYLSQQELAALGQALADGEERVTSIRKRWQSLNCWCLTGARKGEIETLRWDAVDFDTGYLRLAESKTGQKAFPLSAGAPWRS
jgi:integrase